MAATFRDANASAARAASPRPCSERCSPRTRPGSTLPVVAVVPCRTKQTTVGRAGLRRVVGTTDTVAFRFVQTAARRLDRLRREVVSCSLCPRLVAWREAAALNPPASHAGEHYWGRALPGWGDPAAQLV